MSKNKSGFTGRGKVVKRGVGVEEQRFSVEEPGASAWKSGASAPRKRLEINAGFSPGGHTRGDDALFPHPV
ncbi:MAG: hypothetical protein ACLQBK_02175 [Candidatus Sulfotelmatobacter sp.]